MGNVYMEAEQIRYKNASYRNVQEGLDAAFAGSPEGLDGRVTALETTVGDSSSGLVKDVTDLQTTVGDSSGGLVKTVTDQGTAIGTLQTTVSGAIQWSQAKTSIKKNLLKVNSETQDYLGITVEPQADGSIKVYGTATATSIITIADIDKSLLSVGDQYILSGCPASGDADTYRMDIRATGQTTIYDTGSGVAFTYSQGYAQASSFYVTIRVAIGINMGTSSTPTIFYPMIRSASIADNTFAPYILDNVELANALKYAESAFTNVPEGATVSTNKLIKFGKVVMACASISGLTVNDWTTFLNIPDGFRPKTNFKTIDIGMSRYYVIFSGGYVQSSAALSANAIEIFATWITE